MSEQHAAAKLLRMLFEPDDIVNIVDGSNGWEGVAVTVQEAVTEDFIARLQKQNDAGQSIYFCVNPLISTTPVDGAVSTRKIANIRTIKNIMLDVDADVEKHWPNIVQYTPPGYVQETSAGKLQKIWRIRNCDKKQFKKITDAFHGELGGDAKCGDICRLFRLPGFYNRKKAYADNPPLVRSDQWVNRVVTPEEFQPLRDLYNKNHGMAAMAEGKDPGQRDTEGSLLRMKIDNGLTSIQQRCDEPITLGQNFQCPFHEPGESSSQRSFGFVMTDEGYVIFKCHHAGCDAKGDVFDFVQRVDGCDMGVAIRHVRAETYANDAEAEIATEQAKIAHLPVVDTPAVVLKDDDFPQHPHECIDGDLIGELTRLLTLGTFIPPQFARQNIKVALGHILDGRLGFPGQPRLHMRRYSFLVGPPESGKGESWLRANMTDQGALDGTLTSHLINRVDGSGFGSGQFMSKYLTKLPNTICYFDEGRSLFEQAEMKGSTLESVFLALFEGNSVSQGSFKNGETHAENVHLSLAGGFTQDSFRAAFGGRGSRGSGFLSRCELAAGVRTPVTGRWPELDFAAIRGVIAQIQARIDVLGPRVGGVQPAIPVEDGDAKALSEQFEQWVQQQPRDAVARLIPHYRRDLILRVFFGEGKITVDAVTRSIAWAKDQLELRKCLWPDDRGGPVEVFERRILDVLRASTHPLGERDLVKLCNVSREGSGGREIFNRAMLALTRTREIEVNGQNKKKNPLYSVVVDTDENPAEEKAS